MAQSLATTFHKDRSPREQNARYSALQIPSKVTLKQNLDEIYDAIKPLLQKQVPPFTPIRDGVGRYELFSIKEVLFMGKKRKMYFASLMKHKSFVGFYLMTIYAQPGMIVNLSYLWPISGSPLKLIGYFYMLYGIRKHNSTTIALFII